MPPGGVVLDRTYFYPTGGGQPNDQGTLATGGGERAEVVDVTKSGASVVHRLRGGSARRPGFSVGDDVDGAIDWERRFRHMRLHTAQHFLSGRIFTRAGLRTRRASFGGVRALLELDGPLADDVVAALAEDVRTVVAPPRPVAIRHLPRAEWDRHPLSERSGLVPLPPHVDPVRVVEIDGFDLCPCGGTHLRSTGEIGAVVIERAVPVADGGSRLVFTLAPVGRAAPPS